MEVLLTVFVLLQFADAWTTLEILARGGIERNPLLAWGMAKVGKVAALMLAKLIALASAIGLSYLGLTEALAGCVALYVLVLANNIRVMRGM